MGRFFLCILVVFVCASAGLTGLRRNHSYIVNPSSKFWYLNPDDSDDWNEIGPNSPYYFEEDLERASSDAFCFAHAYLLKYGEPCKEPSGISSDEFDLIPETREVCSSDHFCYRKPIYFGYFDKNYQKYFFNFKKHLSYCTQNQSCSCYWPEVSDDAAMIADTAHTLFRELFSLTPFTSVTKGKTKQENFYKHSSRFLSEYELVLALLNHQFFFSDYYSLCRNLENYARKNYSLGEFIEIKNKLDDILDVLYPSFLLLYQRCLSEHYHSEIAQEMDLIKYLAYKTTDDNELLEKGVKQRKKIKSRCNNIHLIPKAPIIEQKTLLSPILRADLLLEQARVLNDNRQHKEATILLTEAIQLDPSYTELYIERAAAYLELGDMQRALKDYENIKNIPNLKFEVMLSAGFCSNVKNGIEFTTGFFQGTLRGAKTSTEEIIPTMKSLFQGVWSFVCSPKEVSSDFLYAAYDLGCYISTINSSELLVLFIPEIRELATSWKTFSEYQKGEGIGYIIGKYGVDIFGIGGGIKLMNKYRALKKADTLLTLERAASSKANQTVVLEERLKRAAHKESLVAHAKSGKVIPANPNVQPHVMQPKHAWEKVITLTGNQEGDFKNVLNFLETHKINSKEFLFEKVELQNKNILRIEYVKTIEGIEIHAVFDKNITTLEEYLKNAWIKNEQIKK